MSTDPALGHDAPRSGLFARFLTFGLVVIIVVGVLAARLLQLQVGQGAHYAEISREARQDLVAIRSPRGLIYDRTGTPLVSNVPSFVVKVRPGDLPLPERPAVIERLSALLGIPAATITETLDRSTGSRFDQVRVASDVPENVAHVISEEHADLPGVEVVVEARRSYHYGALVAHLLGFTTAVSPEDLDRYSDAGYLTDDTIGRAGVESVYERELRGVYGIDQVERDASGRTLRTLDRVQEVRSGNSLELTIDLAAQRNAEKALRWAMDLADLERGVVIAMNPQTGEILAMVSLPNYDNNLFARGISAAEYQDLLTDPNKPLLNYAINEQYPPGSTYKLVAGTGALADRKIRPSTTVETKPFLTIGEYRYYEWNRRGWGPLDIFDGFGHSSDTFFFQLAGMLGVDRLAYWANQYGFGERTGIDLPGEARGTVPTNQWKQDVFGEQVYPGETYQAGIGQGYDTATPLQVLNAYAALANGGRLLRPQVVRRVLGPDGEIVRDFQPQLIRDLPVEPEVLRTMREAARRVVTIRHTYNLVDLPLIVAGKSGTAEFGTRDRQGRLPFHSWFAAFVPKSGDPAKPDSELAVLAFAYDSRTKGNVATEIVKYFLQLHYDLDVDLRNLDLVRRDNFYRGN